MPKTFRDVKLLSPPLRESIQRLISETETEKGKYVPYETFRPFETQAIYYRQSRTTAQIQKKIEYLKKQGAPDIAQVLNDVGPQSGPPVSGALSGESWHNYGLACDLYYLDKSSGKALWEREHYDALADKAKELGLTPGHFWKRFPDSPHVQLPKIEVRELFSWKDINDFYLTLKKSNFNPPWEPLVGKIQ